MGQMPRLDEIVAFAPALALSAAPPGTIHMTSPRIAGADAFDDVSVELHRVYRRSIAAPWDFRFNGLETGVVEMSSLVRATRLPARLHPEIVARSMDEQDADANQRMSGTQAVTRAIDILVAVADGPISLPDLVAKVNIPSSTCHRIATALAERGFLLTSGRSGYRIGPMVKELARRSEG